MAQETGEPMRGAGALAPVEFESEDKSATAGVLKAETATAEYLVIMAEVAQETDGPPGGAGALAPVEFESEDKSEASRAV